MEGRGLTAGAKLPGHNKPSERPRSQRRATGFSMSSSRPRNANCLRQRRQHLQRNAPKIGCCKIIARRRICVSAGPRRAYAHGGGAVSSTKSVLLPRRRHHIFPSSHFSKHFRNYFQLPIFCIRVHQRKRASTGQPRHETKTQDGRCLPGVNQEPEPDCLEPEPEANEPQLANAAEANFTPVRLFT